MVKWIRRHFVTLMVIGSILFVAILVFLGFHSWGISFVQNFGSNWLATLLGVIIGLPLAFWANNYQEQATERERKWKILNSLYNELDYCKIELVRWVDQDLIRTESGTISSVLRNEIWNAYSDGGELEWIKDVGLLAQIADSYYSIRAVSDLADRYYDSVLDSEMLTPRITEVFSTLLSAIEYSTDSVNKTMYVIKKISSGCF